MKLKNANSKKDREIEKLNRQKLLTTQVAKRKQQEVVALQKKNKLDERKRAQATKQRQSGKSFFKDNDEI